MKYSYKEVKAAKGKLQSYSNRLWLEYLVFDPATWIVANFTNWRPNTISCIGYAFGIVGAFLFAKGHFILGAVIGWQAYNLFDTLDGRIARLKGSGGSPFGEYVDAYGGYWTYFALVMGFTYGLYQEFTDATLIMLCMVVYFLSTIHFLEGLQVGFLIGGKKDYKDKVLAHKKMGKRSLSSGILNRIFAIQYYLTKRFGLQEPFNMTDVQHMFMFYIPVFSVILFPIYKVSFIALSVILIFYQLIWFFKYKDLLMASGSKGYKHE